MTEQLPARVDRAGLERVLQRAAELQAQERDLGESISHAQILDLGKEVGIPSRYLEQALLEEKIRVVQEAPGGLWDRMIGPGSVMAQRVIAGGALEAERKLLRYLEDHELLRIQRHQPGRVVWEPLGGFQAAIRRGTASTLGGGRRPFMLAAARSVGASIMQVEPGYSHVVLTADLGSLRGSFAAGLVMAASSGVVAATILGVLGIWLPIVAAPLITGGAIGYFVSRQYRPKADRVQTGLERALDYLELQVGRDAPKIAPPTGPKSLPREP